VFLDESLAPIQLVGAAAVLAAAVTVARFKAEVVTEPEATVAP
jgi:drug/metabolite transporter (DMT)-like permease